MAVPYCLSFVMKSPIQKKAAYTIHADSLKNFRFRWSIVLCALLYGILSKWKISRIQKDYTQEEQIKFLGDTECHYVFAWLVRGRYLNCGSCDSCIGVGVSMVSRWLFRIFFCDKPWKASTTWLHTNALYYMPDATTRVNTRNISRASDWRTSNMCNAFSTIQTQTMRREINFLEVVFFLNVKFQLFFFVPHKAIHPRPGRPVSRSWTIYSSSSCLLDRKSGRHQVFNSGREKHVLAFYVQAF